MSVLLSIVICVAFSVVCYSNNAFQIGGFRHIQQHWMVLCLGSSFEDTKGSMGVLGGLGDHPGKVGRAYVVRA